MEWWYWFGMWVAILCGTLIVWWEFVDAWRMRTASSPICLLVATFGLFLQLPSFILPETTRLDRNGSLVALAGVIGVVLVGVSAIAHFTRSAQTAVRCADEGRYDALVSGERIGTDLLCGGNRIPLGSTRPRAFDGSKTMIDTEAGPTMLADETFLIDSEATLHTDD